MNSGRIIAGLIYRLFLLSLVVAVLWVKGYLWWIFGIAIFLFLVHVFMNLPFGVRRDEEDASDEDGEDSDIENNGDERAPF